MNIKKIGLTALATSLVASSAYAAEVSIAGAAGYTYKNQSGNTTGAGDHGKGFGVDNSLSFSASGELDNGWSVSAGTALNDTFGLSSSSVSLTMGDLGKIMLGSGAGGHAGSYDGEMPVAYEEVDDGGTTSLSNNLIGSTADNGGIFYTPPSISVGGATVQAHLGYTPRGEDTHNSAGGASGISAWGAAKNVGLTITHESGLTLGAYANEMDRETVANLGDRFGATWYAKYAMGPVSVGYQTSYLDAGATISEVAANRSATVGTSSGIFETEQYSIAFNVNDDLSVSYAKADDTYDAQAGASAGSSTSDNVADVTMSMKSIQMAYSMGSMSIKAYRQKTDNANYNTVGGSQTSNEIALGLSF